jgi:protein JSN1
MGPTARPEQHLNLNYLPQLGSGQTKSGSSTAATSPIEAPQGSANSLKSPFGTMQPLNASSVAATRGSAGSPSHEFGGSRLYSKRCVQLHISIQLSVTNIITGPVRFKRKRALVLKSGALRPAATPLLCERQSPSRQPATASQTSIRAALLRERRCHLLAPPALAPEHFLRASPLPRPSAAPTSPPLYSPRRRGPRHRRARSSQELTLRPMPLAFPSPRLLRLYKSRHFYQGCVPAPCLSV